MIAVSSLSPKGRKAWRAAQKVDGRDVVIEKRTESAPWYVGVDLNHYTEQHKKEFYEAVELAARDVYKRQHQDCLRHGLSMDGRRGKMKVQNLSVKRLFGRVAIGLVLSMSGITIVLFFVTKQTPDNIVVVEDGRIAAQGKQEELLASCPLYRQMWQSYLGVRDGEEE